MITLIVGENTFDNKRKLDEILGSFNGTPEIVDGDDLELHQLPDLLMGATLFTEHRLVVIKNMSENKRLWNGFEEWIERLNEDTDLVLVEAKPDKRTRTYKEIQKIAVIHATSVWTDRESSKAEQWVIEEAERKGLVLDKKSARTLVSRLGVDQWQLFYAIEKLASFDHVSQEVIEEVIDDNPTENVFNLFEAALKGRGQQITSMIETLSLQEDAYKVFGLLSSQSFQLSVLAHASVEDGQVAKDISAHPFALSKLAPYARRKGRHGCKVIMSIFAEADGDMKTSAADPWLLIERALMKVSQV